MQVCLFSVTDTETIPRIIILTLSTSQVFAYLERNTLIIHKLKVGSNGNSLKQQKHLNDN